MDRGAIYRRVSLATETNLGGSMDDQLRLTRQRLEADGRVFTHDYCEEGRSAYDERPNRRPVFQQLLADAKAGKFDVIYVYKFDRFSRRMLPGLQARAELREAGVKVISVTEPFDEDTAAGRYSVRNMMNMSDLFSDMLSERMKTRRQAEAASGRHLGKAPVGYVNTGRGIMERQPPYNQMVHALMELVATAQYSHLKIATTLTSQGYTMPGDMPINNSGVLRIARNAPLYAGRVLSNGLWIPGQHPPIIDDELCARVEASLTRRGQVHRRYVRTQEDSALLAGLMYCEACRQAERESKLYYHADYRKNNSWRSYRCSQKVKTDTCAQGYAPADPLEAQALELTNTLALPPEWIDEALTLLDVPAPAPPPIDRSKIEEKIRRLDKLYEVGAKSDQEWQAERRALRAQLEQAPSIPPAPRLSPREIAAYLSDLPALIQRATLQERRAILGELFDQLYATRDRIVAVRPTGLYAPLVEAAFISLADGRYSMAQTGWHLHIL